MSALQHALIFFIKIPQHYYKINMYILSWDCGIRTSAWHYLEIGTLDDFRMCRPSAIKVLSCGVIDFLKGQKVDDVRQELFPGLILEGLKAHGPTVHRSTILLVETQKPLAGKISDANHATQYCISMYYADKVHITKYISPLRKNKFHFGIMTYELVRHIMVIKRKIRAKAGKHVSAILDEEDVRKKHTRMNYDLFMRIFPQYAPTHIPKATWRDLSDSFMQACAYVAHM